jgi:signal transduction histidine kinase
VADDSSDSTAIDHPAPAKPAVEALSQAALARCRRRLERRAAERDELAALLAHDLRNPLASVRFSAELLLQDPEVPERVRWLAQQINAASDAALGLVSLCLEPPDPETIPELASIAVDAALRAAVERARPRAAEAGVEVRLHRVDAFEAIASPRLVALGLDHALGTLIERAPHGSTLDLELARATAHAVVTLRSAAPAPSREREQLELRQYARIRGRRVTPDCAGGLVQARYLLQQTGAELYRVAGEGPGSVYRIELAAAP